MVNTWAVAAIWVNVALRQPICISRTLTILKWFTCELLFEWFSKKGWYRSFVLFPNAPGEISVLENTKRVTSVVAESGKVSHQIGTRSK